MTVMHELIEDYLETWTIVRSLIRKRTLERRFLFKDRHDFEEWLNSVTNLGIADSLNNLHKWDRQYPYHSFAFLRVRELAEYDLQSESRFFRAEKASLVGEVAPSGYEVDGNDPYRDLLERDNIESYLVQLSDDQVEAISLRYEADLSVTKMARIMERKPNAVSALLHRSLVRLEKLLEQAGEKPLARSKLEPRKLSEEPPPPCPPMGKVIPFRIRRSM